MPASQPLYNLACAAVDSYAVEDLAESEAADARERARWGGGVAAALSSTASTLSAGARLRAQIVEFLETDTVCYRIDVDAADPSERLLRKRQDKYYAPLLRWWSDATGAPLAVAAGLAEFVHPQAALAAADDFVYVADPLLRELDIEGAFQAARVEEEWQIAENGLGEDGHDTSRAHLRSALAAARTLLWLSPTSVPPPLPRSGTKGYATALEAAAQSRNARADARTAREDAALALALREAAEAAEREAARVAAEGAATAPPKA